MPYVGIVVNGFPSFHAWEESIHQDKFCHFRWELRSVGVRDHEADVVSHDLSFLHAERLSEIMNADGCTLHVQTMGGDIRVSDAGRSGSVKVKRSASTGIIGFHISEVLG